MFFCYRSFPGPLVPSRLSCFAPLLRKYVFHVKYVKRKVGLLRYVGIAWLLYLYWKLVQISRLRRRLFVSIQVLLFRLLHKVKHVFILTVAVWKLELPLPKLGTNCSNLVTKRRLVRKDWIPYFEWNCDHGKENDNDDDHDDHDDYYNQQW